MDESKKSVRVVGDYLVGKQIGSGSFSVVWHGKHRVNHTEVAIKEIVTGRLTKKLEESLLSEIRILRHINHPNIIHLYDMIQEPGKIYFVLEFCKGGDLSMFLHKRKGRITESTAKHFMLQLASGLKILRDNDLIHRDLKPQNLLLSTNGDDSVLKIADFGFARSLQPRNLAETLCGSPLYMAPEIMQLQKYDAKADLWSVGAILFQLVTGKTPFTGNNQIQLLQNIMRSTELAFPPHTVGLSSECIDLCRKLLRPNPVERLTFEEFFNHQFLYQNPPDKTLRNLKSLGKGVFPENKSHPDLRTNKSSPEDHLPSSLDDKPSGPDRSPTRINRSPLKSTYGFSVNTRAEKKDVHNFSSNRDMSIKSRSDRQKPELMAFNFDNSNPSEGNAEKSPKSVDHQTIIVPSTVLDSFELIAQEYVMVSNPPLDMSSSDCASELNHLPSKVEYPLHSGNVINLKPNVPVKLTAATTKESCNGCSENHVPAPSETSLGSFCIRESPEQPSTDSVSRIKALQNCASTITQLVNEKVEIGKHLEAFSVQLVILAIWKQALHICHTQAASAIEGSPTQETMRDLTNKDRAGPIDREHLNPANWQHRQDVYSQIERAFLLEVGNAEELAKLIEPGNQEMPDAMETIFQSALDLGRHGAVHEFNGNKDAAEFYSKALCLLNFLLLEGPSLIINHPFSLTNSDRYRLQTYIDVLNNRQSYSRSQRMVLLNFEDQQSPP